MRRSKGICKFFLCGIIGMSCLGMTVQASNSPMGSVKITIGDGQNQATEVQWVKIADYVNEEFQPNEIMKEVGDLNGIDTADEMQKICESLDERIQGYDKSQILEPEGTTMIRNLEEGAYFFHFKTQKGKYSSAVVEIPSCDEETKEMNYELEIYPKYSEVPSKEVAPQTGLSSHMHLFYLVGLLLLAIAGGCFYFAGKERARESLAREDLENLKVYTDIQSSGENENPLYRKIDFDRLRCINPDICGWLYVPGTNIDQPILIGNTDETYLKQNYRKEQSETGAVFAFADTKKDLSQAHICLFAHNMKQPLMFGELKQYKKSSYAKEHEKLYIYTLAVSKEYEFISAYECSKEDLTFRHQMEMESLEFEQLDEHIYICNMVGADPDERKEQIVTLACCSENDRKRLRMTAHFKKTVEIEQVQ